MFSKLGRAVLAAFVISLMLPAASIVSDRSAAGTDMAGARKVTIVFSGDDWGNLKSCACHGDGDLGGVARRASFIKKVRDTGDDVLVFEVGNVGSGMSELADIKADFYTRAYSHIKYDAMTPGDWEVRLMTENGRKMPLGESVPPVCANVFDSAGKKLLAPEPYITKTMPSSLKVGIIGVIGDHLVVPQLQEQLGIKVLPPADALRRHVGELRKKCDLLVLLSHTQLHVAQQLAKDFPDIDVILSGHPPAPMQKEPERIGDVLLMNTSVGGKYVGKLTMEVNSDGEVKLSSAEYVPMGPDIPDDPEIVKLVDQHNKDMAAYYQRAWQGAPTASQPGQPREPRPFVTSAKCRQCHMKQYGFWEGTRHAKAQISLHKDRRTSDPECLSCHNTGYKSKGGFRTEMQTPQLANVQCESCHGPGVIHSRRPSKGYGAVVESACVQCHEPGYSPNYKYKEYRAKIACPKDDEINTAEAVGAK